MSEASSGLGAALRWLRHLVPPPPPPPPPLSQRPPNLLLQRAGQQYRLR